MSGTPPVPEDRYEGWLGPGRRLLNNVTREVARYHGKDMPPNTGSILRNRINPAGVGQGSRYTTSKASRIFKASQNIEGLRTAINLIVNSPTKTNIQKINAYSNFLHEWGWTMYRAKKEVLLPMMNELIDGALRINGINGVNAVRTKPGSVESDKLLSSGNTLLTLSCALGLEEAAQRLITMGADVNVKNNNYDTPLSISVEKGLTNVSYALINAGAYTSVLTPSQLPAIQAGAARARALAAAGAGAARAAGAATALAAGGAGALPAAGGAGAARVAGATLPAPAPPLRSETGDPESESANANFAKFSSNSSTAPVTSSSSVPSAPYLEDPSLPMPSAPPSSLPAGYPYGPTASAASSSPVPSAPPYNLSFPAIPRGPIVVAPPPLAPASALVAARRGGSRRLKMRGGKYQRIKSRRSIHKNRSRKMRR